MVKVRHQAKCDLNADFVRGALDYDLETGLFRWRQLKPISKYDIGFNSRYAGKIAGSRRKDGYIEIRLVGTSYLAHRLAWLHHYGSWPELDVDHKDRDKGNNRIANLRPATIVENRRNSSIKADNASGIKGVSWDAVLGKWRAQIGLNGTTKYIGIFESKEDAEAARTAVANDNFGEFATDGRRLA